MSGVAIYQRLLHDACSVWASKDPCSFVRATYCRRQSLTPHFRIRSLRYVPSMPKKDVAADGRKSATVATSKLHPFCVSHRMKNSRNIWLDVLARSSIRQRKRELRTELLGATSYLNKASCFNLSKRFLCVCFACRSISSTFQTTASRQRASQR